LLALCALGCPEPPEFEGRYEEVPPLAAGRDYAYKLDFFRFGQEVGGVVRFYRIGTSMTDLNTPDQPYLVQTSCALFGAVELSRDSVAFTIPEGPSGETFSFLLSSLDPADLNGSVLRSRDGEVLREDDFDMDRVDPSGNIQCLPQVGSYEVVAELPALTSDDAERLYLAVVFAGYELIAGQRGLRRVTVQSVPVPPTLAGGYVRAMRVRFPSRPPAEGLSDPEDGVTQLGLAYLVLFDDDGDGQLTDVAGDEILALSPERVVIYLSGAVAGLHPQLAAVFRGSEPAVPYGLYQVEREVRGANARVTRATLVGGEPRIALPLLGQDNPRVFPVLVPE
jgi:hypothetical protein